MTKSEPGAPKEGEGFARLRDDLVRLHEALSTQARAERRRSTGGSLARSAVAAIAAILLVGGGLGYTAGSFIDWRSPPLEGDPDGSRDSSPLKPGENIDAQATAANPGGGAAWGLSTYTSQQGRHCVVAARVVNGEVRVIGIDDVVRHLRKRATDLCGDITRKHLILTVRDAEANGGSRTLLYGQVDRGVRQLDLEMARGGHHRVRIAPDGTFLIVVRGKKALLGARLRAMIDAAAHVYPLPTSTP